MGKKGFKKMVRYFNEHGLTVEEILQDLARNLYDIMIFKDPEYNSLWVSNVQELIEKYDVEREQIYSELCYELFFERKKLCTNCPVYRAKNSGEQAEAEITDPQGNVYMVRAYPVKDDSNEVIGIFELILEITQRKRLQKRLAEEKIKTEFFTSLSHEFRTPLNLMHTSLQLFKTQFSRMKENNDLKKKLRNYLNIIEQNNFRLLKLVNNLLDINKMDLGKYNLHLKNQNIVKNLEYIVQSSKDIAEKQDKTLKFETETEYKIIAFDPFEIERILLNLISNAFKFTNAGDEIIVRLKEAKQEIIIEVEDTGIGVPQEKQGQIFDKFSQADTPYHRQGEGSGLGLSIVKLIAEMHGGEVDLDSKPTQGSTFIIKLPDRRVPENQVSEYQKNANNMVDILDIEYSEIYSHYSG